MRINLVLLRPQHSFPIAVVLASSVSAPQRLKGRSSPPKAAGFHIFFQEPRCSTIVTVIDTPWSHGFSLAGLRGEGRFSNPHSNSHFRLASTHSSSVYPLCFTLCSLLSAPCPILFAARANALCQLNPQSLAQTEYTEPRFFCRLVINLTG